MASEERRTAAREAKQRLADLLKEEMRESHEAHEEEKRQSTLHCPRHHRTVTTLPSSSPEKCVCVCVCTLNATVEVKLEAKRIDEAKLRGDMMSSSPST